MNLIGKIFIVLILVMCVLWMGFAVAVYATHTNWRDVVMNPEDKVTREKPLGLRFQLEASKQRNQELKDELEKVLGELAAEKAAKRQALTKLETENDELLRKRDQQEKDLVTLVQAERTAVTTMKTCQEALAVLRNEVDGLRADIRQAEKDRDNHFSELVRLTDQLYQAANQYRALKARSVTLAADMAKAQTVLRKFSLKPEPTLYEGTPPRIDGVVLAAGGKGYLEVSIGSDDGLLKNHTLEVYRSAGGVSSYLGRVQVTDTAPDKAVCKILPEYLKGPMQRGDRVASKLN